MTRPTTSRSDSPATDPLEPIDDAAADATVERKALPRWRRALPILLATLFFLAVWQVVVWTGWKPDYLLPGPLVVLGELARLAADPEFWQALGRTLTRAVLGFALALAIGTAIGLATARSRLLRSAIGSLVTGLQTMPSVVWFPLAILLLGLGEQAIMFVVVLGAAPSIANGVLTGVDQVPPAYHKLGDVLGAHGWTLYRHIIIPAALPSYVAGLSQGWAFAWRSLMAGELLVVIPGSLALGNRLSSAQEFGDATGLMAYMIVILIVGMLADTAFTAMSRRIRRRRGLATPSESRP
ncbi:ABC transporter permease [Tessaracoccus sp. MC1679]|uniref:ABC transporter permease n=1 Tax=Tessaracoccus sp. MC1679 TaxID=2760313 RepID=UPI0015FF06EB|nr:ABC transporter permease [Tessaracoccus sp. MC1679]MBB1516883.1 ABC transporter permease [Tessaracoccus sp. MC1679]